MCYTNPRLYFYFFYGRPRTVLLDWLLKTEEGNISYEELKMSAQDRSRWSQWRWKPVIWQSTTERFNWISFRDADVLLQMTEITLLVYMSTCVCFWSVWSDKNALKAALALLVKSCAAASPPLSATHSSYSTVAICPCLPRGVACLMPMGSICLQAASVQGRAHHDCCLLICAAVVYLCLSSYYVGLYGVADWYSLVSVFMEFIFQSFRQVIRLLEV